MKNEEELKSRSTTCGISLPNEMWDKIDARVGGRHGGRSHFIKDAIEDKFNPPYDDITETQALAILKCNKTQLKQLRLLFPKICTGKVYSAAECQRVATVRRGQS